MVRASQGISVTGPCTLRGHNLTIIASPLKIESSPPFDSGCLVSFRSRSGCSPLLSLSSSRPHNQPYFSQPSSSWAVSSVFASGQGQGFSGHQLRINYFTSGVSEDYIMEVNFNNPIYDIGPSLPQECQEPWAALIDIGAVASIAPQSFVPHIPIKEKSETLASVNGGNIKVLGVKHVTFITGKIITHVNFLIVKDVENPIIGLDAIHHSRLQVRLHGKGKCILQQHQRKALLRYHQSHYYASGLVLPDRVQGHHLRWSDPQFTMENHLRRRESRRSLSAGSGSSVSRDSFNTEFSRERTSWTHSFSNQVMVRDLSAGKRASWSAQTSVSEEVKCNSVGS